jgi:hypothetical protein
MTNGMLMCVGWQMKNRVKESKVRKSWYSDECKKGGSNENSEIEER